MKVTNGVIIFRMFDLSLFIELYNIITIGVEYPYIISQITMNLNVLIF